MEISLHTVIDELSILPLQSQQSFLVLWIVQKGTALPRIVLKGQLLSHSLVGALLMEHDCPSGSTR